MFVPSPQSFAGLPATTQSALDPGSVEAQTIATLFWVMAGGAAVIWLAMMLLALHATRRQWHARAARRLVVGGALLPVPVLAALLVYGLSVMPELRPSLPADALRIAVSGEQWWWRVRYRLPDGRLVELANEIRLPVSKTVEFRLTSPDVIHSFWIPALGGKTDMTPGRETTLAFTPTRTGTYRGVCAEYCGTAHAAMNFAVTVMEQDKFTRWLERQAQPAAPPADALAAQGRNAFLSNGCGACHTVRGTRANGRIAPDLTHVGGRRRLAAGELPNERNALLKWIENPQAVKPGVHMPAFGMLPAEDRRAIAHYLNGLR